MVFSRLKFASNKAAKKKLIHFDYDYVIYTKDLPKDVKRWKLILLAIFTGIFGGHYYYVGKYVKAWLMTASFVYLIFCTVFNAQMVEILETYYLYCPIGVAAFAWMISLVYVLSNKFKVPITIDLTKEVEEDLKSMREDFEKMRDELERENNKRQKQNSSGAILRDVEVRKNSKDAYKIIRRVLELDKKKIGGDEK